MKKPFAGWSEIAGKDRHALQRLSSKLFDWTINDAADGSGYGPAGAGEKGIADGIGASQDGARDEVAFYAEAGDPAAFLERAEQLGDKTVVPPAEIPDFRLTLAFFAGPGSHVVGLCKGAVQ